MGSFATWRVRSLPFSAQEFSFDWPFFSQPGWLPAVEMCADGKCICDEDAVRAPSLQLHLCLFKTFPCEAMVCMAARSLLHGRATNDISRGLSSVVLSRHAGLNTAEVMFAWTPVLRFMLEANARPTVSASISGKSHAGGWPSPWGVTGLLR